jgi:dihydrofolate synthase/folylpolyglutamate synthase
VRERFRIEGIPLSKEKFASLVSRLKEALGDLPATYFELTTALAFLAFAEEGLEWAVIECGLGGRLDATNIVCPEVCVITNIGFDHQAYLGETLAEIAREKAGIIKPGIPVVVGPLEKEALEVIEIQAQRNRAPLWLWGRDFRVLQEGNLFSYYGKRCFLRLYLSLEGIFQQYNLGLALKVFELLTEREILLEEEKLRLALEKVSWPGRYEKFSSGRLIILDGAHNPDGTKVLRESLLQDGITTYDLLYAASNEGGTKPYLAMLELLGKSARTVYLCEPPGPRAPVKLKEWKEALRGSSLRSKVAFFPSWKEALVQALKEGGPPLVVAGSLYLVGQVQAFLKSHLPSGRKDV